MTDNRTTELLPCPFCGGEAALRMSWMGDGHRYRAVECVECGATTPGNYSEVGDQSVWNWNTRAEHGTLTAEQVMAIAGKHQPDYCSDTHVCFDWHAIADELNARAERTCRREKHGTKMDGSPKLRCSLCGYGIGDKRWSYCPNCGCKVIGG